MNKLNPSCICLLLLFLPVFAGAQESKTRIEILNADVWEFNSDLADNAERLIGNVKFKHENAVMNCDSAYLYRGQNSIRAWGDIYIRQADSIHIYGDTLNYNGDTRIAELLGKVRLNDPQMNLTTSYLEYNMKQKNARYAGGGVLVNKEGNTTLTSGKGIYYPGPKDFYFSDSVVLVSPDYTIHCDTLRYNTATEMTWFFGPTHIYSEDTYIYCENGWYDTKSDVAAFSRNAYLVTSDQKMWGDSLYYERNGGYGEAYGNVQVVDTVQDIVINGKEAVFFGNGDSSVVTGLPVLTIIFDNDSLFLHGDTLIAIFDTITEQRTLLAYHGVNFFKHDMQGSCDSLSYTGGDSLIRMYTDPVIWSEESQITANRIDMKLYEGKIELMELMEKAFIVSATDTFFNQIKGKNMTGWFADNQLSRIDVTGNGETIYFTEEDTGGVFGMNEAVAANLRIYITDQKIKEIVFLKRPVATLYPLKEVKPEDMKLEDFRWLISRRPASREDIFRETLTAD